MFVSQEISLDFSWQNFQTFRVLLHFIMVFAGTKTPLQ